MLAGVRLEALCTQGDTIAEAQDAWYRTILPVMWDEVKFWPTWTVINFLIIPTAFQVASCQGSPSRSMCA
jgi:hypothetical protein